MITRLTIICLLSILFSCSENKDKQNGLKNEKPPEDMVLIPGGTFKMGGRSQQAYQDEFPVHEVKIDAFYMDEAEVTNAAYKEFVDETGYLTVAERDIDWEEMSKQLPSGTPKPPDSVLAPGALVFKATDGPVNLRDYAQWWRWTIFANWKHPEGPGSSIDERMDHPVVHIAYEDAKAYAGWIGKRLPTEAEWEWASLGGKDQKYPWGNEPAEDAYDKANFWQGFFPYDNQVKDGFYATAPVKSFPPNGYGLFDMAGNVWEWCQDKYHVDSYHMNVEEGVADNPKGPEISYDPREPYTEKYVVRGGSFLCNDSYCSGYRSARRMASSKDSGFIHTGFRCVRDL